MCWHPLRDDVAGTQEGEIQLLPYPGISTTYVGDIVPNFSPAH
jgi:hypothetical protein